MRILRLKTNHLTNPLGFDLSDLSLSYCAEDGVPEHVCVQIAKDPSFEDVLYETENPDSCAVHVALDLEHRTRYFWRVIAEDLISDTAWFETAKMTEPWKAQWISPVVPQGQPHPKLQKTVKVRDGLRHARMYMTGLGLYELSIDAKKQGDEYLLPGYHGYDHWIQYQTFDVTEDLKTSGDHQIGILLGNGWYKGRFGAAGKPDLYGDRFLTIGELHLIYEDGTEEVICTDDTWTAVSSSVLESSIYDGEVQDDTSLPCSYPVEVIDGPTRLLEARLSPKITMHEQITPVEVIHTPAGETVLDLGQNMVGWLTFLNHAPKGHTVIYRTGEILQNGNFYQDNLRSAKSMFTYTSDGTEKWVRPYFTFYGFRYVKLENWSGEVRKEDFIGCVIHSEMEETGFIDTADPLVNQLIHNVKWGQKGNFLDVPTDCPQRDERMGWTGDAQVFSGTASYNCDTTAFYDKYLHDMYYDQLDLNGSVPHVVPRRAHPPHGASAWGDAATIIPWNSYVHSGDPRVLRQHYAGMKAWVDYIETRDKSCGREGLWDCDFHYGDWLALDGPVEGGTFGGTDEYLIASCYYSYSAGLVAKAAHVLQMTEDEAYYSALSEKVRQAVCDEYMSKNGRMTVDTMTAYVVMLYMEITPVPVRQRLADRLAELIQENKGHLKTGFVGTPYLCRVLSDYGHNDLAYTLLFQDDYPSWLYEVKMGATTVWERWNSVLPDGRISDTGMNSLNHYAYGSIAEWIYRYVCGIRPMEDAPGFRRFLIHPQPDQRLPWAEGRLYSASGRIRSYWRYEMEGKRLHVEVTVPYESECVLILPDADAAGLTRQSGIGFMQQGDAAEAVISGGTYAFDYVITGKEV